MKIFWLLVLGCLVVGGSAAAQAPGLEPAPAMVLSSPAFLANQKIPKKYTCQGQNISPPLNISGIPAGTKTLALIVEDPDAPVRTWVHWLLYNIKPRENIPEDLALGIQGLNDFAQVNYGGPCPPSGTHRYFFKLYALNMKIPFTENMTRPELEEAMAGHILAQSELVGIYEKE